MTGDDLRDSRELLREAARLEHLGQVPEALATYRRLLARWPNLPDGWYNLGLLQRKGRSVSRRRSPLTPARSNRALPGPKKFT